MSSSLLIFALVLCFIESVCSLVSDPTNCRVMWNTPSSGRSRVYFTYPSTQTLLQMYVTHNDEYSVPNTDVFAAGYSTGYPSAPQPNTEYYFEYSYNLAPMTTSMAQDYCTINSGAWACGAYIRGGSSNSYSNYVYCGFSNVPVPTRKPTYPPIPTPKPTPKPTGKPTPKPTAKPTAKPTSRPTPKPTTAAPVTAPPTENWLQIYIDTPSTFKYQCSDACDASDFAPAEFDNCGVVSLSGDSNCEIDSHPFSADNCYFYKWNWKKDPDSLSHTCDWDMLWTLRDTNTEAVWWNGDFKFGYKIVNTQTAQEVSFVTDYIVYYDGVMVEGLGWEYCEYLIDGRRSQYLMTRLELMPYDECTECQLLTTNEYILRDDLTTTINIVYFAQGFGGTDEEVGLSDIVYIMSRLGSIGCPAPIQTKSPTTHPVKTPWPSRGPTASKEPTYSWPSSNVSTTSVCKVCYFVCVILWVY
eukprot:351910_1